MLRAGLGLGGLAVVGTGATLAFSGGEPDPVSGAGPTGAPGASGSPGAGAGPTSAAASGRPGTPSAPAVPAVVPSLRNEEQRSVARNGATVKMITIVPQGPTVPPAAELPVCIALHGRGATAQAWTELGLPQILVAAIAAGVPPFAVVALDGGDATYWRRTPSGDDPQRMLLDELPGWLAARGLRVPGAAMGISMGGFGSLRYARNRGTGFGPVAALSPALFRTWSDARAVGVFKDEADWREHEPLLHQEQPHGRPIGVWCGTEDPFCDAARKLVGDTVQARFTTGAHDAAYWRRILPDVVSFVGHALTNRPAG
ncbi:alpha/beta hydrolase-fold protein [Streptomyces sp. BE20]|uniref:alpha/beta hydrolase n=1 Tax=Streptomyces sp. BE20 TaxID=3002525 RepID=UPI002E79C90B|nr:alpha/beta hydrolase-fold protein [Streptomyces sp. BE20]MEE1822294.1 alpha/beta hydrolase-fold protein [Streptomyces sp. BE20]